MRKSFLLLSIIAAISVVAAEAPAAQSAFNQPGEKVALPDNFAFDSQQPQIIQGEKFQFQVPSLFIIKRTRLSFFIFFLLLSKVSSIERVARGAFTD